MFAKSIYRTLFLLDCFDFAYGCIWIWELDYKESWALKNWCFWTVALEKTWESLRLQGDQPVHPKGNESWIFIGRTDAEAETPVLWPPDAKNWLTGKDPDAGKDWRQEEKGMTEDGMVGWHHQLNGHEFEQAPGVSDGQGSLACYSPWGHKESDMTEQLNWTDWWVYMYMYFVTAICLGFIFGFLFLSICFVWDEVSCTGSYWWLGDARSCIQVVSFVWVLTIWYSLALVLW